MQERTGGFASGNVRMSDTCWTQGQDDFNGVRLPVSASEAITQSNVRTLVFWYVPTILVPSVLIYLPFFLFSIFLSVVLPVWLV